MKKNLKIFVFMFLGSMSLLLCGCAQQAIKIQHETSNLMNDLKSGNVQKVIVKKSSGIIIYKDNSTTSTGARMSDIHFGPNDINFDLTIK